MTEFQDPFSKEVWETTYKHHTDKTVDDTMRRVAKAIASVEKNGKKEEWEAKFYEMLTDFKLTAGGRIYANAGTGWKGTTLINCFVLPEPETDLDSLDGILDVLRSQAKTLKSEGGVGHNYCLNFNEELYVIRDDEEQYIKIGNIRPGDLVKSSDFEWHLVEEKMEFNRENMIELTTDTGTVILVTDDHPFLVIRNNHEEWIEAKDILETDELVTV